MASTTGGALRQWREDLGIGLDDAAVDARRIIGRKTLSRETIRRYETVYQVTDMDPVIVAALVKLYGRRLSDLPNEAADHLRAASDLLISSFGWMTLFDVQDLVGAA